VKRRIIRVVRGEQDILSLVTLAASADMPSHSNARSSAIYSHFSDFFQFEPLSSSCDSPSPRLDDSSGLAHRGGEMKAVTSNETAANNRAKPRSAKPGPPRMTRRLAELRAVGDAKGPKFDGVAWLRSFKK